MTYPVPVGTQVGTLTISTTVRVRTSEQTACNYRLIDLEPGTYPITMGTGGYWFVTRVPGVCVESHFVNRVFQHTSLADTSSEVGQPMSYGFQWDYPSFLYSDRHDQPHDGTYQLSLDRTVLPLAANAIRTATEAVA